MWNASNPRMRAEYKQRDHVLRLLSITVLPQLKVKSAPFGNNEHWQSEKKTLTVITMIFIIILTAPNFSGVITMCHALYSMLFRMSQAQRGWVTAKDHPAGTHQSRDLNPDLSGSQVYSYSLYCHQRGNVSREQGGRKEKELAVANIFIFSKHDLPRLKSVRTAEFEC